MSKVNNKGFYLLIWYIGRFFWRRKVSKKKHFIFNNIEAVRTNIKKLRLKNTKAYRCKFPSKLNLSFNKKKFKLCHLDVNTYKSTQKSFEFIKNKIIKGGTIVFDDYGIYGANSIKKFVNQISKKYKKDFSFIYNFMGQCILIKK